MNPLKATQETVDHFNLKLQSLVDEAQARHVVLEIELLPTLPLKMGGHMMAPRVRAEIDYAS